MLRTTRLAFASVFCFLMLLPIRLNSASSSRVVLGAAGSSAELAQVE
jgi:hypothetical protein